MEITKQQLIEIIHEIGEKIEKLAAKSARQRQQIKDLESQNEDLKKSSQATLDQVREYIKELEQIRSHYVDSNNNIR